MDLSERLSETIRAEVSPRDRENELTTVDNALTGHSLYSRNAR
jgi:hypothetical protein